MINRTKTLLAAAAFAAAFFVGAHAAPSTATVGQAAPDFTLTDINGKRHTLSSYKGKTVVIEWVNPECPIVVKHYEKSGNIPKLQKEATSDGIVWLTVNSGHPGAQGDFDAEQVEEWMGKNKYAASAYLKDPDGKVGRMYDARTTPHMYIVDQKGTLVYAGGIDSIQSGSANDIPKATNYVREALKDLKNGQPVRTATSKPYGCSVKYGKN
jgi:peroxiredoxin